MLPLTGPQLSILRDWQRQRMIELVGDATWVALGCRFNMDDQRPEPEALVLAPPSSVSVGDRVEIEDTRALVVTLQSEPGHGPPIPWFVATVLDEYEDGWQASCAAVTVGNELFKLGADGLTVAEVFRGLIPGSGVQLCGNPADEVLDVISSDLGLVARAIIPAVRTVDSRSGCLAGSRRSFACPASGS